MKKIHDKVSVCSLIVNILPITPFRGLVPAFRKPPVILEMVTKAGHENVHWRNSTNESEGNP
jgi:hypothetical protein